MLFLTALIIDFLENRLPHLRELIELFWGVAGCQEAYLGSSEGFSAEIRGCFETKKNRKMLKTAF